MGHDTNLFLQTPPAAYECCVCFDILKQAVSICDEGHSCCRECANALPNERCPLCNVNVAPLRRVRVVDEAVSELDVRCNVAAGWACTWTGPLSSRAEHVATCLPHRELRVQQEDARLRQWEMRLQDRETAVLLREQVQHPPPPPPPPPAAQPPEDGGFGGGFAFGGQAAAHAAAATAAAAPAAAAVPAAGVLGKREWVACFGEEEGDLRFIRARFSNPLQAPDIHAADDEGASYVHVAAQSNRKDILRVLLNAGANSRQRKHDQATPLFLAAQEGAMACAQLLLEVAGDDAANDSDEDSMTPLYAAAAHGHLDIVRLLLAHGATLERAMHDGATPLFIACQNGHEAVARMLLARGADTHVTRAPFGQTPLYNAVMFGEPSLVRLLLAQRQHGVNIACRGNDEDINDSRFRGCVPLHACNAGFAARRKRGTWSRKTPIVELSSRDRWNCYEEIVLLLLRAGADANVQDDLGWTAGQGLSESSEPRGRALGELLDAARLAGSYDSWGAQHPTNPFVFQHATRWQLGALLCRATPPPPSEAPDRPGVSVRLPGGMDEAAFAHIAAFAGVA